MATANAAGFTGTEYLTAGGALTGAIDSKLGAGAAWFYLDNVTENRYLFEVISGPAATQYFVRFQTDGAVWLIGDRPSDGVEILDGRSAAGAVPTGSWNCIFWSFDMADTGKRHFWLNDTNLNPTWNDYTDDVIDFTSVETTLGGRFNGILLLVGRLGPFWHNFGQYVDWSLESNRRIFRTAGGKVPSALANSTDGDVGGLGQPIWFHNNPFDSYETNLGTDGSTLTENGTLTEVTGPEIAGGTITVPQADLQLDGKAPILLQGLQYSVPQADLALDGKAPTVAVSSQVEAIVPQANLVLDGKVPSILTPKAFSIPQADLVIDGKAPMLNDEIKFTIPQANLVLDGKAPRLGAATSAATTRHIIARGIGFSPNTQSYIVTLGFDTPKIVSLDHVIAPIERTAMIAQGSRNALVHAGDFD